MTDPFPGTDCRTAAFTLPDPMQSPAAMPAETPLAMPEQDFARLPRPGRTPAPVSDDMTVRRTILILMTLLLAALASTELRLALSQDGLQAADVALLLLFWPLFAWIAFGFVGALVGYLRLVGGQARVDPLPPGGLPSGRTAILVPVRNEDADAVAGRILRMARDLARIGAGDRFAFFVLSDSTPQAGAAEAPVYDAAARRSPVSVHYRRRAINHARKPGNVADWVRRHGAAWDYMLVLDADSMMGGRTIAGLARALDAEPGAGLIQTVPSVAGATTLFGRWHQFASRLYGPVASAGLMWWSGTEATFWGHNAIIRTAAFAESCGLPELSGPAPFGGHIMSHDMVEAALLRRNGWAVHMVMAADSSEEYPPTLVDHAIRDRRWCQGNVQHLRLLGTRGFHWVGRLQLLIGASAYLTSPLWLLLLVAASAGRLSPDGGAGLPEALAPSSWIMVLTVLLLFGPKLMGLAWALGDAGRRRGFGGTRRLLAGFALDVPLAVLTAPATMLTQVIALAEILLGRASGWAPQCRETGGIPLGQALRHYRVHLGAGLGLAAFSIAVGGWHWMAPVFAGLVTAPSIAALTSRRDLGDRAAALGLFQVPGEAPPRPAAAEAGRARTA